MKAFDRIAEAQSDERVRQSLTHYSVKDYFENASLVEAKPVTGRTHQIRVHLAAIGHGLLGDVLYSRKSSLIERQALHAAGIAFIFDGILYEFAQEIPTDMQNLITHLRASCAPLT
jgi:23S rRNA pseudouridine1911/1915/1917 synthase